ncbi:TPA_asm: hypothetical protein vir530_00029 [dsDNA virus vir530]|jgi:hypothetical protein|nr:TPA_asm: hypothetical protein vir530_00029 [dsDNA virus vir530]
MMTAEELDGLINTLNVLTANGFGNFKDEAKVCSYIRHFGEVNDDSE